MKRVTKTNIVFTTIILVYMIMANLLQILPFSIGANILVIIPEVIILLTAIGTCKLLGNISVNEMELSPLSFTTSVKCMLLGLSLLPSAWCISAITSLINGNAVSSTAQRMSSNPVILNIILMALIPAAFEEIVFRGIFFGTYKKRNPFGAIFLSALLFGLMHMNINQFSYAFLIGIVLATVDYVTGSVWAGFIIHFVINAVNVLLMYVQNSATNELKDSAAYVSANSVSKTEMYLIFAAIIIVSLIVSIILFYSIAKENRGIASIRLIFTKENRNKYRDEGKFFDGYLILGIAICVLYMIYHLIR